MTTEEFTSAVYSLETSIENLIATATEIQSSATVWSTTYAACIAAKPGQASTAQNNANNAVRLWRASRERNFSL